MTNESEVKPRVINQRDAETATPCPACGGPGRPTTSTTLKAMLAVSLTAVRNVAYRFCPAAGCSVVYYSDDGKQRFTEDDLREKVYNKHADDADVLVCYCFQLTTREVREDEDALTMIEAGVQAGQCACDIRNPQGTCCIGNVRALIAGLAEEPRVREGAEDGSVTR